jgi:selenocysteine lyase/cysteine desulfurase
MQVSRRHFLGATSGAATLGALGNAPRAQRASTAESDPLGVRADFPAADEVTYLNTAYIGLISRPVVAAGRAWLDARAHRPLGVGEMLRKADEVRHGFAGLINAADEEIGLLFATSEGENVVADALDLRRGDNVVIDDLAYPSTSVIHKRLEQSKGVEVRIVRQRDGATRVEDFARLVDRHTRLISVTWVSNLNGFRHDMKGLADLAHAHGAFLYADAIQAVGMGPVDVRASGVDFLCCGSYKWLMAGFGVAPFFVRRELLDRVRADRVGWHVEKSLGDYRYQHFRNAKKYEFASLAFGEIYQLGAALDYLQRVGLDRIEQHTLALTDRLRAGLVDRGFSLFTPANTRSSILSFYVAQSSEAAERAFDEAAVKISMQRGETDEPAGPDARSRVRVAVSLFNNAADIDRLLAATEKLRMRHG